MVEWNQLDVASFLEQATGFLAEHGQLDGPSCHAPPAKRARSVGFSSQVSSLTVAVFSLCVTLLEFPLSQLRFISQTVVLLSDVLVNYTLTGHFIRFTCSITS